MSGITVEIVFNPILCKKNLNQNECSGKDKIRNYAG